MPVWGPGRRPTLAIVQVRIRVKIIQEKGSHERDPVGFKSVRQEDIESSERMETREGRRLL